MTNDPQEQTFVTPEKTAVLVGKVMAHGMLRDRFMGGECFASGQREEFEAFEELQKWQDQFFEASMDIRQRGPVPTSRCYVLTEDGCPRCKVCAVKGDPSAPYHLDNCPIFLLERLTVVVDIHMSVRDVNDQPEDIVESFRADTLDLLLPDLTQRAVHLVRCNRLDESPTVSSVRYAVELGNRTDEWVKDYHKAQDHVNEVVRREMDISIQNRIRDLTVKMVKDMVTLQEQWDDFTESAKLRRVKEFRDTYRDVLSPHMDAVLQKMLFKP